TMARLASAVVACPGGIGTFEELMEIITWRDLGLWNGNIVILNTDGYYDPLLHMLAKAAEENFMRSAGPELWSVAHTPEEAVRLALRPTEESKGFTAKS
ncbi:MAG: LOG family protein, partial [Muribaculaceae bacterium]|nr:LOG family protein [Muribaculaceae bacterium]